MIIDADELKRQLKIVPNTHVTLRQEEARFLIGIDEVGRGPLIGDVLASAVLIPVKYECESNALWASITDSKKLSEARREQLAEFIMSNASGYAIGRASCTEIDQLNILHASLLAMRRAYLNLQASFEGSMKNMDQFTRVIVDGRHVPDLPVSSYAVVRGDHAFRCVGAASILAKVKRDKEMVEMDKRYPGYGLAQHKGYPTKQHQEALERLGPTHQHRRSFGPVKRLIEIASIS